MSASAFAVRGWLPTYGRHELRADLIAGLTLAAYLLPAAIGDASLAGLPAEAGLYACLFSGLVFWIFCSSRHTVVTVTSALSLLVGTSVAELSAGDPARHAALAAAVTLMVAAIACAAWLGRAGAAVNFFSETVLVGFKAGLALYLAATQLPKLFGFKGSHGDFWERAGHFLEHLGSTHPTSLALGLAALAVLVAGKLWFKHRPIAFLVVVAGVVAARGLDLDAAGVALLGEVPQGLPVPGLPDVSRAMVNDLLPLALASFVLAAVESSAIGRMFARKHGYRFDANQELLALGASNLLAGLGRGFPVSGGMSQSLVNESAGARTPISGLVAAVFTLAVAVFASGLLRNLPQPVLAAIVLAAVMSLVDVTALRHIWHFSRAEFFVAVAALLGVLGSGPVNGVLLGAAMSIALLLRQAARPRVVELGRLPGTAYFADRQRHPEAQVTPDVLVIRCESALVYFNAEFMRDRLLQILRARPDRIGLVVFFMGAVPRIDLAGVELVADLRRTLKEAGIELQVADAHGEVRDALRRIGFDREHGPLVAGRTVDAIVSEWQVCSHVQPPAARRDAGLVHAAHDGEEESGRPST
jgi:high affinity sulfate transporter 1